MIDSDLVVSGQLTAMLCHYGGHLPHREVPLNDGQKWLTTLQKGSDSLELTSRVTSMLQGQPESERTRTLLMKPVSEVMRLATPFLQCQGLSCKPMQQYQMASQRFGTSEPTRLTICLPKEDKAVRQGLKNFYIEHVEIGELKCKSNIFAGARQARNLSLRHIGLNESSFQTCHNLSDAEVKKRREQQTKQVCNVESQIEECLDYKPPDGYRHSNWSGVVEMVARKACLETIRQLTESTYQEWSSEAHAEWVKVERPLLSSSHYDKSLENDFQLAKATEANALLVHVSTTHKVPTASQSGLDPSKTSKSPLTRRLFVGLEMPEA